MLVTTADSVWPEADQAKVRRVRQRNPSKKLFDYLFEVLREEYSTEDNGNYVFKDNCEHLKFVRQLLLNQNQVINNRLSRIMELRVLHLPIVLVLGPREEDISHLCTHFVTKYKTSSVYASLQSFATQSSRLKSQGQQVLPYRSVSSPVLINELQDLLRQLHVRHGLRSCDGIIVSGFPRSMDDIVELKNSFPEFYVQLSSTIKAVCLIDYTEELLSQMMDPPDIDYYKETVLIVAENYDNQGILSVIEGPTKRRPSVTNLDSFHALISGYDMPLNRFSLVLLAIWSKERHERRHQSETTVPSIDQRLAYDAINGLSEPLELDELEKDLEYSPGESKDSF